MCIEKWRFPASHHGERKGLTSGDTETFKKHPYQAFAREILQNSIDARDSDEEPVMVEFSLFDISPLDIPDYVGLKTAIQRCKEFWKHKDDYVEECDKMLDDLNSIAIRVLKVSDYNTTGLVGIDETNQEKNKFLALTKGTGVSEKSGSLSGGSKGVGKNAAFLMSSLRTVFYSTNSNSNINGILGAHIGSIGVSELVSGYIDDVEKDNRDYTQGTGYFSSDDMNSPLGRTISFGEKNNRANNSGTDIYILGFKGEDNWESDVISGILDSFMAAIYFGDLEIRVNNLLISKDTLKEIINNNKLISEKQRANIVSQFLLLSDNRVIVDEIETDYGTCELHLLPYGKEEDDLATHKCSMIRFPLMKIKDVNLGSSFRVSALCIIKDDALGKFLKSIENPQHIDWETSRIGDKQKRKEANNILKSITSEINNKVIEHLQTDDDTPLDPNGAGEYIPDIDVGGSEKGDDNLASGDKVSVSNPVRNKTVEKNAERSDLNGEGLEPDIGAFDDEMDGNVEHPIGHNETNGDGPHPGNKSSKETEGDDVIFKEKSLPVRRYKIISTDKEQGRMKVIFISPGDYEKCYLKITMLDDSNNKNNVSIESMRINGNEIESQSNSEFGPFSITNNQKVVLEVKTRLKGYFASEVKVMVCK